MLRAAFQRAGRAQDFAEKAGQRTEGVVRCGERHIAVAAICTGDGNANRRGQRGLLAGNSGVGLRDGTGKKTQVITAHVSVQQIELCLSEQQDRRDG